VDTATFGLVAVLFSAKHYRKSLESRNGSNGEVATNTKGFDLPGYELPLNLQAIRHHYISSLWF